MSGISTIPRTISKFGIYVRNTDDYIAAGGEVTNGARLLMQSDEIEAWHNSRLNWDSVESSYSDPINQRTRAMSAKLHDIINDFVEMARDRRLIQRIESAPSVTSTDLEVFNIPTTTQSSTSSEMKISTKVQADVNAIGGGRIEVICRHSTNSKASTSIPEGADLVDYRYTIGDAPESATSPGLISGISTRAKFEFDVDASNRTKYINLYFRWFNSRHQECAGPWTDCIRVIIT